jgi:SagB-type dehydrogenase family enzyme
MTGNASARTTFTLDEAYTYTSALLRDPQSANDSAWKVDWEDGPWPVKVYAGGERLSLRSGNGNESRSGNELLGALGRLLAATSAITRVRIDQHGGLPSTPENATHPRRMKPVLRRPVPSGGAMYPTEAYVLLTTENRLFHHDPYRHELTDLYHPSPRAALRDALGLPREGKLPPAVLMLTNRFWKNFYKYGDFACRLGSVDVGVVLGRAVRLASAYFGHAQVRLDFRDEALNACLGLDGRDESTYAVIGLGPVAPCPADPATTTGLPEPPIVIERSRRIKRSSRFDAMNAAACHPAADGPAPEGPELEVPVSATGSDDDAGAATALPEPESLDLLDPHTMINRASKGRLFNGKAATAAAMGTVLHHTAKGVADLRNATAHQLGAEIEVYCAVHHVDAVPAGWYRYHTYAGDLVAVGSGHDGGSARELQAALFAKSLNIELAAFTLHIVTPLDWRRSGTGPRAYREQQLVIGAAVEAATLAAAAVGLGSHPVLGFDASRVDQAYGLRGIGKGAQAQISVGAVRPDLDLEISVRTR